MASTISLSTPKTSTTEQYKTSIQRLHRSLKKPTMAYLAEIPFPTFRHGGQPEGVESTADELQKAMDSMMLFRIELKYMPGRAQKVKDIMDRWFRASYPFAEPFLSVAAQRSLVIALLRIN
jgi:hypothetical protein